MRGGCWGKLSKKAIFGVERSDGEGKRRESETNNRQKRISTVIKKEDDDGFALNDQDCVLCLEVEEGHKMCRICRKRCCETCPFGA